MTATTTTTITATTITQRGVHLGGIEGMEGLGGLGLKTKRGVLIAAGALLGVGLGGLVDGIVLHQILQWHSMLSSTTPPTDLTAVKTNMLWDGIFNAFAWLMTAGGLGLLWRAGQRSDVPWSTRTFLGSLPLGWGMFNLVEGVISHHILGLHHVNPGADQLAWDIGFLVFGALLSAGGYALILSGSSDVMARGERVSELDSLIGPS